MADEATTRWTPPAIPHGFLLYPGKEWGKADSGVIRALDSKLRALSLSAYTTDFSGLAAFAPNRLWALSAERMPVHDEQLAHLSDITSLTKLELNNTDITDAGLAHLIPLEDLAELLLFGTKITDHGLRLVGRFANLKNLNLGETAVTDEGLAHLSQLALLDALNLRGTQVRGPGLRNLHRLKELDWLALSMNIDRDAKKALKAALPDLQIV